MQEVECLLCADVPPGPDEHAQPVASAFNSDAPEFVFLGVCGILESFYADGGGFSRYDSDEQREINAAVLQVLQDRRDENSSVAGVILEPREPDTEPPRAAMARYPRRRARGRRIAAAAASRRT